jgi:UDP-N-acetylmuramate dehydrogenase
MSRTGVKFLEECLERVVPSERVRRGVPMREHTSFRIGGPVDYLVTVESRSELTAVLGCCRRARVPYLILGRGTNLLVRDGGLRGVAVTLDGEFLDLEWEGSRVEAGAAVSLADLARECGRRGLSGLEFAVGIPGSVGGAVVMNAGAYDRSVSDVLESAEVLLTRAPGGDPAGSAVGGGVARVPAAGLGFGYRQSHVQEEGWVVLRARFRLVPGDPAAIQALEEEFTRRRRERQPLGLPSAGSVFKRPPGHYAGRLIEEAGLKGLRVGDAQVSEKHVGFIVNLGGATARDVLELIRRVQEAVFERSGVFLEPEIKIVGEDP